MAEKVSKLMGPDPRKLKVGKSFEKKSAGLYHGIRYDFKPVSIDEERDGVLEVKENSSIAVSLPNVDGMGQTNYKGHIVDSSSTKECILIIDHVTGELTIERISSQILVKKTRAEKPDEKYIPRVEVEKPNPYEVKKVPDKPVMPSRDSLQTHRPRKPSQSKETDSDFCITPMNSAKSSPARSAGSAKPSPNSAHHTSPNSAHQVDSLGRPLDSDSTDSSDSSDSDSDFGENKISSAPVGLGGSMPSFLSQDFSSNLPALPPRGGVLPTARPESHKSSKSLGQDASRSRSTKPAFQNSKVEQPPNNSMTNLLGDDLRLSDSDNSD